MTVVGAVGLAARLGAFALTCAAVLVATASPASAHGSTPDGTNYRSSVAAVVDERTDDVVDAGTVTWSVVGGEGLLQVRNTGWADVVVTGYDDEPYLRVGPDGVFENRNSPAAYLNTDRFGNVAVPSDVAPDDAPDWRRLSDGDLWRWHDHRIHWMAPTPPPQVRDRPHVAQRMLAWAVPFQRGEQRLEVRGTLRYTPPPVVWPWLLGSVVAVLVPVAIVLSAAGTRHAVRLQVVLTALVAVAGLGVAIGDVLAMPAGVGADLWAVTQTAVPLAIVGALAWTVRRATPDAVPRPGATLVVAAVILAVTCGVARLSQLTSSHVVNSLPAPAVRSVVAVGLTLWLPALLLAAVLPRRPETAHV